MTRSEEERVIQQLVDTCRDVTLRGIGESIGETETMMRYIYHWIGKRSLTIAMEKKLYDLIDEKIRNLVRIIIFMKKHQLP